MTKRFSLIAILCISLLALAACNTANPQETTTPTTTEETNTGNNTGKEDQVTENENSITYTSNNTQKTEETTTIISDEQHYSIQVIQGFTLTAEEPGKDVLYLNEDDSISMRIEYMSSNDTTFQDLVKSTEEMMSVVNENVQYTDFDIQSNVKNHSNISNFAAYKVDLTDQAVISVVFEKENQLVRLTIFDKPTVDLTDAFVQMGLSISSN